MGDLTDDQAGVSRRTLFRAAGTSTVALMVGAALPRVADAAAFAPTTCTSTTPPNPDAGLAYAWWAFGSNDITSVEFTAKTKENPGSTSGLFLQFAQTSVDDTGQYLGIQTGYRANGVTNPAIAIMSRFGTLDKSNVRAASGSYVVASSDEGGFVSLRRKLPAGIPAGTYKARLVRGSADNARNSDWFDYRLTVPGSAEFLVGSIRFPRRDPAIRATITDIIGTWTEAFLNPTTKLPLWRINVVATAHNSIKAPLTPQQVYVAYSNRPNSDVSLDKCGGVDMSVGGNTCRVTPSSWYTLPTACIQPVGFERTIATPSIMPV